MTFLTITGTITGIFQIIWTFIWIFLLTGERERFPFLWFLALAEVILDARKEAEDYRRIDSIQVIKVGDKFSARKYQGDNRWYYLEGRTYRGWRFEGFEHEKFVSESLEEIQQILSDLHDKENPTILKEYKP